MIIQKYYVLHLYQWLKITSSPYKSGLPEIEWVSDPNEASLIPLDQAIAIMTLHHLIQDMSFKLIPSHDIKGNDIKHLFLPPTRNEVKDDS